MARSVQGNLAVKDYNGNEREVRRPKRNRKKTIWSYFSERTLYLLMIVVFVVMAMVVISRYAAVYELNLRTSQLEEDIKQLQAENTDLKIKMTKLADPASIIEDAKTMGLRKLDSKEINIIGYNPGEQQEKQLVSNQ